MKTVKFEQPDSRLALFSDSHTFIVATNPEHIDSNVTFQFADRKVTLGTIFTSIGKNVLHTGYSYLEAQKGNYYQFKGVIDEVTLPGFNEPMMIVLFSSFSTDGPNTNLESFGKEHGYRNAYFALAYNTETELLEFIDNEHTKKVYAGNIEIVNDDGALMIVDGF